MQFTQGERRQKVLFAGKKMDTFLNIWKIMLVSNFLIYQRIFQLLTIQTAKTQPYFEVEFWKCPFLFYSSIYYVQEELRNILAGWLCGSVAEI